MVYAYLQDVPIDEDMYRQIIDEIGPEPLAGSLLHLCVRTSGGALQYIDVWESEEACAKAFDERIHPAVDKAFGGNRPATEPTVHRLDVLHAGGALVEPELVVTTTPTTGQVADPETKQPGARVFPIPPPLYYAAGFAGGMALRASTDRLGIASGPATAVGGAVVLVGGMAVAMAGVLAVVRHRTTIVPHHPVRTLLTEGIYRRTRNPMYTGLAIAYVGGSLLANSWWPLCLLPLVLLAVRVIVIGPEERYLAEAFGDSFTAYRARTRRWL